jgi:hypothetical protein
VPSVTQLFVEQLGQTDQPGVEVELVVRAQATLTRPHMLPQTDALTTGDARYRHTAVGTVATIRERQNCPPRRLGAPGSTARTANNRMLRSWTDLPYVESSTTKTTYRDNTAGCVPTPWDKGSLVRMLSCGSL